MHYISFLEGRIAIDFPFVHVVRHILFESELSLRSLFFELLLLPGFVGVEVTQEHFPHVAGDISF